MSRDFCENFQKSVKPRADRNKKASKKGVFDLSAASQVAGDGSAEQKFSGRQSNHAERAAKIILKRTEKVSIKSRSSGIAEPGSERTRRGAQGFRIRPKTDCKQKPGADTGKQKREKNKCGPPRGGRCATKTQKQLRNRNAKPAAKQKRKSGCETETQKRPRAAAFVMLLFCLRPRSPLFCPSLRGGDRRHSRRSSNGSACFCARGSRRTWGNARPWAYPSS